MGRRPGYSHKKTVERKMELLRTLKEKGFDPVAALVEVYTDAQRLYKERLKHPNGFGAVGAMGVAREAASDIMQYVYPKQKSVEMTGADGADLFQSFNDLVREIVKSEVKE